MLQWLLLDGRTRSLSLETRGFLAEICLTFEKPPDNAESIYKTLGLDRRLVRRLCGDVSRAFKVQEDILSVCHAVLKYKPPQEVLALNPMAAGKTITEPTTKIVKKEEAILDYQTSDPLREKYPVLHQAYPRINQLIHDAHDTTPRSWRPWPPQSAEDWTLHKAARKQMEMLCRVDKIPEEVVVETLEWMLTENHPDAEFWRKNLLSLAQLRKMCRNQQTKFDNVRARYIEHCGGGGRRREYPVPQAVRPQHRVKRPAPAPELTDMLSKCIAVSGVG